MPVRLMATALVALIPGGAVAADAPVPCERLASQIGLKHVWLSGPDGQVEEWRRETASLFKGAATRLRVKPVDPATATGDDYRRLEAACDTGKDSAECTVVGPARVELSTRRGDAMVVVAAGERAIVGIRRSVIFCRRG